MYKTKMAASQVVIILMLLNGAAQPSVLKDFNLGYLPEIIRMLFFPNYSPPEVCPNLTLGVARDHGYPTEEHYVTTDDGYVLRLDRVKGARDGTLNADKVVFLMFGASSQSIGFVANGPGKALALVLADAGYDVWMGNLRGGTGSRGHTSLDADRSLSYWQFSVDTFAEHDIPAMINFVTSTTGVDKVYYIGTSMGGGTLIMNADTNNSIRDKVRYFANLGNPGPRDLPEFLSVFLRLFGKIYKVAEGLNLAQEFGEDPLYVKVTNTFCGEGTSSKSICTLFVNLIFGYPPFVEELLQQPADLSCYQRAMVGTFSIRAISQVSQMLGSGGVFKRFNYGLIGNLDAYGSFSPPDYDISKFTVPTSLFWTVGDPTTTRYHMENFPNTLPNLVSNKIIDDKSFGYFAFMYSDEAKAKVYDDILRMMESY